MIVLRAYRNIAYIHIIDRKNAHTPRICVREFMSALYAAYGLKRRLCVEKKATTTKKTSNTTSTTFLLLVAGRMRVMRKTIFLLLFISISLIESTRRNCEFDLA